MHTRNKPLKDLAREAIDVQDASNLRGVLRSWWEALCQDCVPHGSTEEAMLNALYLSKVASLLDAKTSGIGSVWIHRNNLKPIDPVDFSRAYEWAYKAKVG